MSINYGVVQDVREPSDMPSHDAFLVPLLNRTKLLEP